MKKILLGSAALVFLGATVPAPATDMPIKGPVYKAPEPIYDWSGLYVGVYTGVGMTQTRGLDPIGGIVGVVEHTGTGFAGGLTTGYNWQFNRNWVVGIEGDIGYLGLSHNVRDHNEALFYNTKTSWTGTLRGRVGYTSGPTLTYITAGGALVDVKDSIASGAVAAASSKTESGFVVGTGVETMLGGNWTAKAESLYYDLGKGNTLTGAGFTLQNDKNRYQVMKFGFNYLFGGKMQPMLPSHNWTGFYAGGFAGTALTEETATSNSTGIIGNNGGGLNAGGLAGYNWQFAPHWVAGIEGDFGYFGVDHANSNYNDSSRTLGLSTSWLATARGRLGYSTGPALLYVTGGGAWVDLKDKWTVGAAPVSSSKTFSGGAIGGGIETVLGGNWTSKTEYLYVNAGKGNVLTSGGITEQADHTFHVFRSALIYKFE
ncbi:MAG TPA: outer membrane beta-barrel protein [Xanthobacteraceae bacterium]|nr:outer membrane beta-barrel protein [Xanthobacteraceae bacterium]